MLKHISSHCRRLLMTLSVAVAAVSCSSDFTYTSYPCYLVIDNSVHQNTALASAMTAQSPGVFCLIRTNEARKKYLFETNMGMKSEATFTAIDLRQTRKLGMNDALIVGFGTLTSEFYAFDRECPECFDPNAVPVHSRPLSMSSDGMATCGVCKRRFNMNTGGNCVSEGGARNMTRYRMASTTGPFGTLAVTNR